MAHLNPISLDELKDNATNCRVKRHLISKSSRQHGQHAEIKSDRTILTQGVKMGGIFLDLKLYSKVLRICERSLIQNSVHPPTSSINQYQRAPPATHYFTFGSTQISMANM